MVLLAAFATLLHRYTGQTDLPIAGVSSTQCRPELRGILGPFINTLVMRLDLSAQPSFVELVRQVRETVLAAVEHQTLPFAKLVEALRPDRRLGRHPLFQVLFLLDPASPELPPGWSVSRLCAHNGAATCDLSLQLDRRPDGLHGFFEYSAELFDSATIARWSHHLEVLLAGVLADPSASITDLPLLPPQELEKLEEWSGGRSEFPVSACLHELFAAQVRRAPDAIALVSDQTTLTYRELDTRANRLAARLRALGVGPDAPVGLCCERSIDLVVGILGILKAGGAYVPLDPVYPRDRIRFMLEDTAATAIVIQTQTRQSVPASFTGAVVCLDDLAEETGEPGEIMSGARPEHLAYIIYTSGSTGKPKGVQVTHENVVRLFAATAHWYRFDHTDVWCLFHSFAFDVSVWELWGAFLHGGRLVIVPYWVSRSPEAFCRLVSSESVTVLNQTPSAFYQFMAAEQLVGGETPLQIRWVVFAGEALDLAALLPWIDRHGDERPRLINMYGITETTVHVTYRRILRADCERAGSVIGVPMLDLRCRVLDRRLRPTPIGIPGELFVGGAGVARGYLNRPELTRERFITDPYLPAGGPLYRSGDWVRYRESGELEYLGRIDHQVKIRGFRVEMGEIEGAVSEHPEVHAAVVMLREDLPGDKRIVAYIVPKAGSPSGVPGRVRAAVEQKLPAYMVPSHIVPLDALPLTQNGKVDRHALPAPDNARPDMRAKYVAPRTFLEEELATIFAEVLSVEKVGVNDSFFDLGGHSLLVIRVIFRVREVFHIELPMRAVFDAPTVAGLARQLETLRPGLRGLAVPPIETQRPEGRLPLSFAQQRLWFLAQLLPDAPSYNEPVTIRFRGPVNATAIERGLDEILVRHEAWRTTFQSSEGEPFQIIHPPAPMKLPIADLRSLPAEAREAEFYRLCSNEAHRPFSLVEGPLVRFLLLVLSDDDSRLFIVFHHIVADGLSIYSVFNVELARLYRAFSAGQPAPLPPLPIQYADFALWQRRWLSSDVVDRQLTYWRQKLGPQPPVLQLPVDHPPPAQPTFRGARQIVSLPLELTQRLRRIGHREGATLFITLLTALKALLYRYVQQDEVVIGIVTAGRQRPELAPLLGFFPNTLVLRSELAGDPSFRVLLRRVREVTLQAFDNQDVPFERVVEALNPERRPGETPLFRVGFILDPLAPELGNDWAMTSADIEITAAKFDLGLELVDVPEGIIGRISYRTELFEPTTIARMAGHYAALLASAANDPDQPLSDIKLLSEAEWQQLAQWGAPAATAPASASVVAMFAAQAARAPDAPAVRFRDQTLSYRELDEQSSRLAHALRARGVGPEVIVALGVERSPLLIVGMLGILKAGGAFLTLDPAYPRDRLAFMLGDAGVELMITESALVDSLPAPGRETLVLDDEAALAPSPRAPVDGKGESELEIGGRSLAYVIYTSGSTGRPKGVLIEHQSLSTITAAHAQRFGTGPGDRVLQFTSPSFDVAVLDIMLALTTGATLVVPPREALLPGPELLTVLSEQQITTLQLTPSALSVLPAEPLPDLRTLVVGGEPLPKPLLDRWLEGAPSDRRIYNAYGPTETTICATLAECRLDELTIPIGRPLPGAKVYVLDDKRRPVPVGITGELYIGGAGVARGYLNRPELTSERFVDSPIAASERLYRTGDLGRWRENGQLEFIGRADSQVKIRGFRIELGEIEAALADHPDVREAAVIARADGGEQHLIAYTVLSEPAPAVAELRHYIALTLPQHMIPAAIIAVPTLPRTPSGKVDRRALAQLELHLPPRESEYLAAENDLEQALVAIWQDVLHVDRVGINDNFFDLGGHSLLVVQVQRRLREACGREVSITDMFRLSTIKALAAHLGGGAEAQPTAVNDGLARAQARRMMRARATGANPNA
jgi:amino acid adenylation domain-containing protein